MKKTAVLCALMAGLSVTVTQAEERFIDKASRTVKKVGEAVSDGAEKGVNAANKGAGKGFEVVDEKVLKPADGWIQNKVGRPGAGNTKPAAPVSNSP
ncbi:MAG: hypothetical protein O9318_02810 [Hylemonella sp.]|uniref:hypothetical protein n=1 Tax=Hylemonella sp. TaxID=2066020 RepID=UPI0022BF20C7|nr:hypothetical protein [Hylemonella sp.]MCZ8251382.1 hypothetical protein [Hylemonella sp.]